MEIDIEDFGALESYLRGQSHIRPDDRLQFYKLLGGVSNKTVKVAWPDRHGWVIKQALPKLRVNADWFSSPERIQIESKGLRWLNRLAPSGATPGFLWEDPLNHLMAMEAVPEGHQNWKSVLLSGHVTPAHFEQFAVLLGTIQRRSSELADEVLPAFPILRYFESLRLEPYYLYSAEKIPAAAGFLQALVRETYNHRFSLVHGDFSPKNTLLYQGRLILIDHEVVHFGDPAFDVGFALTHFLSKAHHVHEERSRLADSAQLFWRVYAEQISELPWADTVEPRVVRHTLGCLLARVAGKSRLEYLSVLEMSRQQDVVLSLIAAPPPGVADLIDQFVDKIHHYDQALCQ